MVTEQIEVVKEHEPEKKTEDIAKKNSDIKEQKPIEESKTKTEVEPMEVDAPEVENNDVPSSTDDKKAVTVAESNIADDGRIKLSSIKFSVLYIKKYFIHFQQLLKKIIVK